MTTVQPLQTPAPELLEKYPALLRMGHRFETSIGQRLIVDGFYGAMDFVFGGDGWFYVLNRYDSSAQWAKIRIAQCNIDDEFPKNLEPLIDGEPQVKGEEQFFSPVFCDGDQNGTMYFTDERANKVIAMSTETGDVTDTWGVQGDDPGMLNAPSGITYMPDGTMWIVCSRSSRVQHFTSSGEFIEGFGEVGSEPGQMSFPWGVAIDPVDGSVVVADWRNDRIQRFTPEGDLLQVINELGRDAGTFDRPSDVAIDAHGDLYVCDRGNNRVVQFNRAGLFIEELRGDAVMTERGADKLMANPDMLRWRDHIVDLGREKLFWKPTAVKIDDKFGVYVIDSGRYRMQVYRKTFRELADEQIDPPENYMDPKIN